MYRPILSSCSPNKHSEVTRVDDVLSVQVPTRATQRSQAVPVRFRGCTAVNGTARVITDVYECCHVLCLDDRPPRQAASLDSLMHDNA